MAIRVNVDPQALRSAAQQLRQQAPQVTRIPDSLKQEARQAGQANRGFMTGEAGESLVEALEGAMKHYQDHIDTEADLIDKCADEWESADGDNKSNFDGIGTELSGLRPL